MGRKSRAKEQTVISLGQARRHARSRERARRNSWTATCIIQARMGSTRLPGKTLARIAGQTTLERVVERVKLAESIKQIVVATSDLEQDDLIVDACNQMGVDWFRGAELDVLSRYLEAASYFEADPIIRVTADCPLIDPGVLNALVRSYHGHGGAFVANNLEPSFPHGLDAEVFSLDMLRLAANQTGEDYDAEHVTGWMRRQSGAINLKSPVDLSHIRITLDTQADLDLMRAIYRALSGQPTITTRDVLDVIERSDLCRFAHERAKRGMDESAVCS